MRRIFLAFLVTMASAGAWAQVSLFDLGLGTRAMGLGGAYAALAEDAEGPVSYTHLTLPTILRV